MTLVQPYSFVFLLNGEENVKKKKKKTLASGEVGLMSEWKDSSAPGAWVKEELSAQWKREKWGPLELS